jgi:phosphopantothenoylcysteine decarboxylase/phosphopantothenate--cysteine ligase
MTGDVDVAVHSNALLGKHIALGITGGIAATEAVRLLRELRRHGAKVSVIMTSASRKVITPLAVGWAAQGPVITDWSAEMAQLEKYDAILVAPASRNFISRFVNGMMDHPLLMACSAARSRNTPIITVPSMHNDLFDDPVTQDLLDQIKYAAVLLGPYEEGRYKQPSPVQIVAELCHMVNKNENSRHFAVTLGANRAPIDAVRAIQNASSGRTGWAISEYLYRFGHDVSVIAGKTSADPSFDLPNVIRAGGPDQMLDACLELASGDQAVTPNGWVHAAAVLDYIPNVIDGKKASGSKEWPLVLKSGPKHIDELSQYTKDKIRIGFKLETNVDLETLHQRALAQIQTYGVDATIANIMEQMNDAMFPRAYLVTTDGITPLAEMNDVCESILSVLTS